MTFGIRPLDPHRAEVEDVEHLWIEMPDGVRLSARLWLPAKAHEMPVPAVLEYIPYRKRDMVRARDERNHPFLAARGFACLRVDMRGSGDSEGLMSDMYQPDELADARHVISWIAAQPWCDGAVGMFGTSWGGTASLQASVDAPLALKAVIAVCATHDRYEDDIHHKGGCLLTDSIEWGATLPTILGSPPDAETLDEDWFERWKHRLDNLAFPLETWVREEARGAYWRHGSVVHQRDRITCPILAVGGWSDRYSNSVMSLVDARPDIAWGVVGPWGHHYPDVGHPGPTIGFQHLMLAWWSHWLRPEPPTDIDWPKLRCWLCEFDPPADVIAVRNGRWIESGRPSRVSAPDCWCFTQSGLARVADRSEAPWPVPYDLRVGQSGGDTGYFGRYGGQPLDQREDDRLSLTFDTAPLTDDYIHFGKAEVELQVHYDAPISQLAVRINDVAPDGTSCRVALSLFNLALDDMLDEPSDQRRCGSRRVRIPFHSKAYRFRAGHRIRVAIASSYWPMAWPPPKSTRIRVAKGQLCLRRFDGTPGDLQEALPEPADLPVLKSYEVMSSPVIERYAVEDETGALTTGWHQPYTSFRFRTIGTTFGYQTRAEHRIDPADPLSARSTYDHRLRYERPDGDIDVRCSVTVTCDSAHYHLEGVFEASLNGEILERRHWNPSVPRRVS